MKISKLENSYYGMRTSDGGALYICGFAVLYLFNALLILIAAAINNQEFTDSMGAQYLIATVNQVAFFSAPFIYGKVVGKPMFNESRIRRGIKPTQAITLVGIAIASIVAFLPFAEGFISLLRLTGYNPEIVEYPLGSQWWELILSVIFVAVLPAIGEEFLFRGGVARALKTKSYILSILMSASLFAIVHGNASQFVHQFLIGGVFALVYFITGSLWSSIIVHFVNNAVVILIEFFIGSQIAMNIPVWGVILVYIAMAVVGLLALYSLLRLLTYITKGKKNTKSTFFVDFGRAFYPKGITRNYYKLNATLKSMYNDPVDSMPMEPDVKDVANVEDIGLKMMLIQNNKLMQAKRRKYDYLSVILAYAVAMAPWIVNMIKSY